MKSVIRFFLWIIFSAFIFALFGFALGFIKAINQDYFKVGYLYLAFFEIYRWVWSLAIFGAFALSPAILLSMIVYRVTGSRPRAFIAGFSIPLAWLIAFLVAAYLIQTKVISAFAYLAKPPFNAFDAMNRILFPFFVAGAPKFKKLWSWIILPYVIINVGGIIIGLILQLLLKWVMPRSKGLKSLSYKLFPVKYFGALGIFGLVGLFILQTSAKLFAFKESNQPNVLFISIDTLRADHMGLYGYQRDTTPNIDRLKDESLVFLDCFAPSPWTLPSHGSMLSGYTPMVHGATRSIYKVHDSVFLLSEVFKQYDYKTAGMVSVPYLSPGYGFSVGFDHYFFLPFFTGDLLTDMALKIMEAIQEPFFFFLHIFDPHWPYKPPDEHRIFGGHKKAEDRDDKMFFQFAKFIIEAPEEVKQDYISLYDAEIHFTDYQLNRIFELLQKRGLWDNTIIVITSDHGEELYDHGFWGHTFFLYQEALHVPLIIKPHKASGIEPKRISKLVGTIDIAPTILELAGFSFPKEIEGKSLVCLMKGECEDSWVERYISYTSEAGCSRMALRDGYLKYLQGGWCKFADVDLTRPDMLFDLKTDPLEKNDLSSSQVKILENMQQDLENWLLALNQKWPLRYQKPRKLPKQTEEQLKALGYIQ